MTWSKTDSGIVVPHHVSHEAGGTDVVTVDHANLTNVTPDQHHAQAHTLLSHSTKPHSDLTGIGADDHHAQAHTLLSHSTKPHSDLTGIGIDDHHARDHSVIGATHSGFPGGTTTFLRADATFAAPTAAAADPVYSPGSFTVATETGRYIPSRMKLTITERATIQGTGRLVIT